MNLDKANICAKELKKYFKKEKQDANILIPNDIKIGSTEHIIYIFYSCLLDYGMRSKVYHANLVNTYKSHQEIFNPKYIVDNYLEENDELLNIMKENIHPRYPRVAVQKWINLSKFICENYPDNSLIERINSLTSYKELYNFIISIKGYGQKTGGLLLRLIYESGICSFADEIADIPIDRHDVEISYLNGVIDKNSLNEQELKELGDVWIKAAKMNNISACDIDKYLWTIGNSMCNLHKCDECPLSINCKKKK